MVLIALLDTVNQDRQYDPARITDFHRWRSLSHGAMVLGPSLTLVPILAGGRATHPYLPTTLGAPTFDSFYRRAGDHEPRPPVSAWNFVVLTRGLVRYQQCGCFHFLTFNCYRRQALWSREGAYGVFARELEAVWRR